MADFMWSPPRRTGRDASSRAAQTTENDQMTTKSTTHASERGRVQIPAAGRDRKPEFHEDSIKPAVIACFTVRDRQNPETHPCP